MTNIEKPEKASSMSKILLATAGINYMALQLHQVNTELSFLPLHEEDFILKSLQDKKDFLESISKKITDIFEELSDYSSGCDIVTQLDESVMNPIADVLIFGKDNLFED